MTLSERFEYPVKLKRAREGGFVVSCRDLPALVTQGEDRAHALAEAADAMDEVFATTMKLGRDFPASSLARKGEVMVAPPPEAVAKAALYVTLRSVGATKVELARRLKIDEKEARRLLDPHYPSKLPRIADAIARLGGRLVISLERATVAKPRKSKGAKSSRATQARTRRGNGEGKERTPRRTPPVTAART